MHILRNAKQTIGPLIIVMAAAIACGGCGSYMQGTFSWGESRSTTAYNTCRWHGYPIDFCTNYSQCTTGNADSTKCWHVARCKTFKASVGSCNSAQLANLPYPNPPNWCGAI